MSSSLRALLTVTLASSALAQSTDLVVTLPLAVHAFARHPSAALLCASLPATDAVAVIDTETLQVVATIPVGDEPRGLAFSPDARLLYVCTRGVAALDVVDAVTWQRLAPIPLPNPPWDVEAGLAGRVYVSRHGTSGLGGLMQVETSTGQAWNEPLLASDIHLDAMLEIAPDRTRLWIGTRGSSPAKLICFDVSAISPTLAWTNAHGALGSAGQDLTLTDDGAFVSYAVATGNSSGDIFKIDTGTFASTGAFVTRGNPREIAYAPDGAVAYTVSDARIRRFDAASFAPFADIATAVLPVELVLDRTGRFVFAAFTSELRVYGSGFGAPSTTPFCFGDGRGAQCPCGNSGASGRGCESSIGAGGASLSSTGIASVSADTLAFLGAGLPASTSGIVLQGMGANASGMGTPFGDGLLCVDGALRRLGLVVAQGGVITIPAPGEPSISARGLVPTSGATRYYQLWYRNSAAFCTSATVNLSNGLIAVWAP